MEVRGRFQFVYCFRPAVLFGAVSVVPVQPLAYSAGLLWHAALFGWSWSEKHHLLHHLQVKTTEVQGQARLCYRLGGLLLCVGQQQPEHAGVGAFLVLGCELLQQV